MTDLRPGPLNAITDVAGLRVGHAARREPGWLTGTTVLLTPSGGAVAGVDVRGGGPGTRETDLLDPRNLVDRVHAVLLGGGSALGLAAADGIVQALLDDGIGWPMGVPGAVVPIVPGAILFDLGRGGVWRNHPTASDGAAAYAAARGGEVPMGGVGAATGARAGGFKGAIGTASVVLPSGHSVGVLVAVNSAGSPVDPRTGELYAVRHGLGGEFDGVGAPSADEVTASRAYAATLGAEGQRPAMATTIGIIATDATLTKAQCQKVAGMGHDGMARAINPVHTLFDGDTLFAVATGERPAPDLMELFALMAAAGECVTRAIGRGLLAAESADCSATGGVVLRSYRDVFPSAFGS
ncbi:P1 family peptidase [Lapillicoccus sp.]|uniref:P1 family peptidase n=1 Tax=Lapillicoccus sp. TaxID=1909287 RepID=UPI0025D50876|nr:P1 family peptidase [Lapillicoccus sp.]